MDGRLLWREARLTAPDVARRSANRSVALVGLRCRLAKAAVSEGNPAGSWNPGRRPRGAARRVGCDARGGCAPPRRDSVAEHVDDFVILRDPAVRSTSRGFAGSARVEQHVALRGRLDERRQVPLSWQVAAGPPWAGDGRSGRPAGLGTGTANTGRAW